MKHIKTVAGSCINKSTGAGCGECQASCKTSCTVANQSCQNKGEKVYNPARKNA